MNFFKTLSLFAMALLCSTAAMGQDSESPFSSPEEKRVLLELAGRDGQISRDEWAANAPETGQFQFLNWSNLQNFDLDGDGLIGLNEFYKYIDNRARQAATGKKDEPDSRVAPLTSRSLISRSTVDGEAGIGFDRSLIYRRAQIAKRTKLQQPTRLSEEVEKARARIQHLRTITERRRAAAAELQPERMDSTTRESLRDLYKSRLVKNRFVPTAEDGLGTGISTHRQRLMTETRAALQGDDSNRRRDSMMDLRRKSLGRQDSNRRREAASQSQTPDRSSSSRQPNNRIRTRETSDIRGLIPAAKQGASSTKSEADRKREEAAKKKNERPRR